MATCRDGTREKARETPATRDFPGLFLSEDLDEGLARLRP
jgi:hypothetical protein